MRLIDLDSPYIKYLNGFEEKFMGQTVLEWLDDMPTVDAVQVVRCGECSHSEVCKMDDGDVRYCHIFEMQTEDDYYCADGESLEEDDLPTSANHDEERREE